MSNFAVIENGKVSNIVVCENLLILAMLIPEADLIIEITETTGPAYVGCDYRNNKFVPPQTFPSWIWNEDEWDWVAPKPRPTGDYYWNIESSEWEPFPEGYLEISAISVEEENA